MKLVFLDASQEGEILAKTIYGIDGNVLLTKGMTLNAKYIARLKEMGIESAYIVNKKIQHLNIDLAINDIISDKVRQETLKITKQNLMQIIDGTALNSQDIISAINHIIDDLVDQNTIIVNLTDIRSFDNYTFAHCVNVAILSIAMGVCLGYSHNSLKNLGIGALLHDIGKIKVPISILNKKGSLNPYEFSIIQKHPQHGFDFIRQNKDFSILSAHVAYQHHEKYDGTGYPQGLKEREIHVFSRIVSIIDVYDALTANRPYRRAYLPHKALEFIMGGSCSFFDPELVKVFLKYISPYPIGTIVRLNTGELGIIIKQNPDSLLRPVVLIYEKNKQELTCPVEKSLVDYPTVLIEDVVTD